MPFDLRRAVRTLVHGNPRGAGLDRIHGYFTTRVGLHENGAYEFFEDHRRNAERVFEKRFERSMSYDEALRLADGIIDGIAQESQAHGLPAVRMPEQVFRVGSILAHDFRTTVGGSQALREEIRKRVDRMVDRVAREEDVASLSRLQKESSYWHAFMEATADLVQRHADAALREGRVPAALRQERVELPRREKFDWAERMAGVRNWVREEPLLTDLHPSTIFGLRDVFGDVAATPVQAAASQIGLMSFLHWRPGRQERPNDALFSKFREDYFSHRIGVMRDVQAAYFRLKEAAARRLVELRRRREG